MSVHHALDDDASLAEASFLPVDLWIEAGHERVSENDTVLSQVCEIKVLEVFFSSVQDPELTEVHQLSLFVLGPIYIVDFDGFH